MSNCCSTSPKEVEEKSKCALGKPSECGSNPAQSCCDRAETNVIPKESSRVLDVEKGFNESEHVVLSVQGLTCVGCENKLSRSLEMMPSVQNIKTSLVMSQAEFDVILGLDSVTDVIRNIKRTTGFVCERVAGISGQNLDLVVLGDMDKFLEQPFPVGVLDKTQLDHQTIRLAYDPHTIGARDIYETKFVCAVELAPIQANPGLRAGSQEVRRTGYMTLLSAILTIPVLIMAWAPLPPRRLVYDIASLALATIVQVVVAGPFYPIAFKSLVFTHMVEMDLLIVLSTTAAYVFSVVSFAFQVKGQPLLTRQFFETSTLLVTLIMLGRFISALARQKAVESISVRSLQTKMALLMREGEKEQVKIDARLLQHGDVFKAVPDSCIVTDGVVISGNGEVDESMITGEAQLVPKSSGSLVIAGSVNGSSPLIIRLTRLPSDNTISEIANMVDEAKFSKPKSQELADFVAGIFVPVIVGLTIITFTIWIIIGIVGRGQTASAATVQAITYAIPVLIVSCPCALGLAVPMVIVIAGGVAAKRGVIFKSAQTIAEARKVTHVVFDKTGTLTEGKLKVVAEEHIEPSWEWTASCLLALTSDIKHPVSQAISRHLRDQGIKPQKVSDIETVTGKGIQGTCENKTIRAGNARWLNQENHPKVQSFYTLGYTVFCLTLDNTLLAIFGLQDSLRPDLELVISELKNRNIAISIVSGDDQAPVNAIATHLGIPDSHVRSRCSPAEKQQYIKDLMDDRKQTVLFCGDGTNDAVALAQATIGVHMSEGTDVAQSAADAVLMRPALQGILVLIDLSKAAFNRIVFNFAWSFVYNIFAILLAAGAFVNARIPPEYAGLGEIVSVLPVILVAVQLRWARVG